MGEMEKSLCEDPKPGEDPSNKWPVVPLLLSNDQEITSGCLSWSSSDCWDFEFLPTSTESQPCLEIPHDKNEALGDIGNGFGVLVAEDQGKEACGCSAGVEGDDRRLILEDRASVEAPRTSSEEENYDIMKENSTSVPGSSGRLASCATLGGLTLPQLSPIPNKVVDCPSEDYLAPVVLGTHAVAVSRTPACCNNAAGSCRQAENGRRDTANSDSVIDSRCSNPKPSATLKSRETSARSKTRKKTKLCKHKELTDMSSSGSLTKIFSNKVKRKRSYPLRRARLHEWGAIENIIVNFEQANNSNLIQTRSRTSAIRQSAEHVAKHQTIENDGRAQLLHCKSASPSNSIHVKDTKNLQVMFSDTTDSLAKANAQIDCGISVAGAEVNQKVPYKRIFRIKLRMRDGEKETQSTVTKYTAAKNMSNDCPGVSSQVAGRGLVDGVKRHMLDPGTSPRSDVFHSAIDSALIASENHNSRYHDSEMDQNGDLSINVEGVNTRRSNHLGFAPRRRRSAVSRKKRNMQTAEIKEYCQGNGMHDASQEARTSRYLSPVETKTSSLTASAELSCKPSGGSKLASEDLLSSDVIPLTSELEPKEKSAWVLCDDCQKWRRIPVELANIIDRGHCQWTCKDNKDEAFANCLIPQEKTNSEINAELEISDEEDVPTVKPSLKEIEQSNLAVSQTDEWKHIKSNQFVHRNHKNQNIDEVMVCHCKPPLDGSWGCGDECLNRIVNIECDRGACPCGDLCSNRQFQKRKYAKLELVQSGKKGYGLQLQENVVKGQFLIEYVGEVISLAAYEARQSFYALKGHRHFYFMTLTGGEVIDARAKGNLGRFINHSCDPNCETQKWFVDGEVCIGFFAVKNINKGEEVTIDYHYERVFGAAATKCLCGSSRCRGYIGGTSLSRKVISQADSDEESLEPVVDAEEGKDVDDDIFDTDCKVVKNADISMPEKVATYEEASVGTTTVVSDNIKSQDAFCELLAEDQVLKTPAWSLNTVETEETDCNSEADALTLGIGAESVITKYESRSDFALDNKLAVSPTEDKPHASQLQSAKFSHLSGTVKKSKSGSRGLLYEIEELPVDAADECFGVESKLNHLLDAEGGISRHNDATRGYLKLLFVTAAEGNDAEGASQSLRDLSLILDALLKTKSRMVLVDIINKNGLQMLQNIMRQNRENFIRTPIVRKLVKVLDFLAQKEILTLEHMNKGPPCSGMESFKESMLKLTRHSDMKVHQKAMEFRDKWMLRTIRTVELSNRDDDVLGRKAACSNWSQPSFYKQRCVHRARDSNAIVCVGEGSNVLTSSSEANILGKIPPPHFHPVTGSTLSADSNSMGVTHTRKRKSGWDQPSDSRCPDSQGLCPVATSSILMEPSTEIHSSIQLEVSKEHFKAHTDQNNFSDDIVGMNSKQQYIDVEARPGFNAHPGFGSPSNDLHVQVPSKASLAIGEVAVGQRQERYLSHLSVSYGVPVALMQQLGTPGDGGFQSETKWEVAPGMPFHPFPPLPPYPRGESSLATGIQMYASYKDTTQGVKGDTQTANLTARSDVPPRGAGKHYSAEGVSWPSRSSGRKFFQSDWQNRWRFQGRWSSLQRGGNDGASRGHYGNGVSSLEVQHGRREATEAFHPLEGTTNKTDSSNLFQQ